MFSKIRTNRLLPKKFQKIHALFPYLSKLVQMIKIKGVPKREMALAYLLANVSAEIRNALICHYSILCSHPHPKHLFQQIGMIHIKWMFFLRIYLKGIVLIFVIVLEDRKSVV